MAESKHTKLQMAKEIQHLIAAAQDMSAVMDLEPPIKTDYLIDLKNKTVTATHLQNVVANLQADIKRDASMIEPEDKFDPETHKVLADLNVKVPRPATKEEAVEDDEDELEPTASPDVDEIEEVEEVEEVAEKEKPIKKEKKNTAGTTEKIKKEKATATKEKDEFGFTVGSKLNFFANAIKEKPMTMKEVCAAPWNKAKMTYYSDFKKLVDIGVGIKTPDGKMAIK